MSLGAIPISAIDEQFRRGLINHYRQQRGGSFPVYRGADYQYGNGIVDIFKSIGRFLLPIFAPAAAGFLKSTATNMISGQSLKESAKAALKPTLTDTMHRAAEKITDSTTAPAAAPAAVQGGSGRRRKRKNQPRAPLVYKDDHRPKRKRTVPAKKEKAIRFLPTNF